jgi:hypothetical protein
MTRLSAILLALPAVAAAQPTTPAPPPAISDVAPLDAPVAGMPGYKVILKKDASYCGGRKLVVTRPKRPSATDAALADVLQLASPTGLDFDPTPSKKAVKEKSMRRFNAFIEDLKKRGTAAKEFYAAQIQSGGSVEVVYASYARSMQSGLHLLRLIRHVEIPKDVRTGELATEKIAAFCDKMAEVIVPMDEQLRASFAKCREGVAKFHDAWWVAVCPTD